MRLNKDEVALLRMLDKSKEDDDSGDAAAGSGEPADYAEAPGHPIEAPKTLFEFNLINRLATGELQLTKTGSRALFQAECIDALEQTLAGAQPPMAGGVERWLVSSGFLHGVNKTVTSRGKLWLASLTPDDSMACPLAPHHGRHGPDGASAEAFAARRGA